MEALLMKGRLRIVVGLLRKLDRNLADEAAGLGEVLGARCTGDTKQSQHASGEIRGLGREPPRVTRNWRQFGRVKTSGSLRSEGRDGLIAVRFQKVGLKPRA